MSKHIKTAPQNCNNKIVPVTPTTNLSALAVQINTAHDLVESSFREGVGHAIHAGELLIAAKKQVLHGEWEKWLRANVRFQARTARAYMQIAELDPEKRQRVADLPLRQAMKAITQRKEKADDGNDVKPERGSADTEERKPTTRKKRRTPEDLRRDIDAREANTDALLRHAKSLKGIYDVGMRNGTFPPDLAISFDLPKRKEKEERSEDDREEALPTRVMITTEGGRTRRATPEEEAETFAVAAFVMNPIIHAWDKAGPQQRRDFVLACRVEIMRAQHEIGRIAFEAPDNNDDGLDIPASGAAS
jgi:hypothetical protein